MRAPQRVALATRQDEFKLLQKPWQGILLLALHEVEAPGADEDEDDGPSLLLAPPVARVLAVAVAVVGVLEALGPPAERGGRLGRRHLLCSLRIRGADRTQDARRRRLG